ncbi:MAG: CarD family transcriptional regulator [Lachnospiraceae bacterium]|nr:CarD family transcriptional regulator [Lachnospiraceae bacterium]MBQ6197588.1 CarD family transcriptional regulator [Lachnospiraceae bacterium]
MYSVNDTVLYAADGVCTIAAIVEKNMLGAKKLFYELHPVFRRDAVLFLPTDNEKTMAKLRRVLTRDEIISAIHGMTEEETIWIEKESTRKEEYARIIKSGDHKKVIRLIKTLYEHRESLVDSGHKMHAADENFLKDAESVLYEEFAYVLKIHRDEVLPFIQSEIENHAAQVQAV